MFTRDDGCFIEKNHRVYKRLFSGGKLHNELAIWSGIQCSHSRSSVCVTLLINPVMQFINRIFCSPDLISFDALTPTDHMGNLNYAFDVAEKKLEIARFAQRLFKSFPPIIFFQPCSSLIFALDHILIWFMRYPYSHLKPLWVELSAAILFVSNRCRVRKNTLPSITGVY